MPILYPFLIAAGTGLQIISNWSANTRQAMLERENAEAYREQAELARAATQRELDIASRQYANQFGNVVSGFAAQGVDVGSGSAATQIASVAIARMRELDAIKKQGEFQIKLASSRSRRSKEEADLLSSVGFNLVQAGTTALTATTKYIKNES